jgi:phosphoadenosine phosphosulfate reductase
VLAATTALVTPQGKPAPVVHQATRGSLPTRPQDVRREIENDPVGFAERANDVLDGADPLTILSWAGRAFGRELVVTASMGDTVMAHIAGRAVPGVDLVFVDTGYHFIETIGTVDAVKYTYPVRLLSVSAEQTRAEHEAERGELFKTNPDACCAIRKVAPLNKALGNYRAWATGLRRDDSLNRAFTPTVAWDHKRKLIKISPIAPWTDDDVEGYLAEHPDVVSNPLLQLDYRSIGCEPCTQPVKPGEDARSGRWAGMSKTECGIHI